MMTFAGLLAAALAVGAGPASAQDEKPSAAGEKLLESCDAHKFETIIQVVANGVPKRSRVKLCGTEGQSDADWIGTLKDAVAKTQTNATMAQPVKDQIVAALNGEINRLSGLASATPSAPLASAPAATTSAAPLPPPRNMAPQDTLKRDYASLPPLPSAPPPPTRVLATSTASLPILARPRLSMTCFAAGDLAGDGPCTGFERDTLVTVKAGEDLPAGTSVRFVRNGDNRADVQLAQLKRGKTMRFALPREVCKGVVGGTLEIRIVRSAPGAGATGQEVGREGPYNLRC